MKLVKVLGLSATLVLMGSCKEDLTNAIIANDPLPNGHRVCIIGDGGTGKKEQMRVAKALETEGCDQVRYLGDVIYEFGLGSADDKDFAKKFYDPYRFLIEDLDVPFFLVMGNHDHYGTVEPWLEIAPNFDNIVYPYYYYVDKYADVCFINIDTNFKLNSQKKWLEGLDEYSSSCKIKIAMAHHPYLSVGRHGNAKGKVKNFLEDSILGKMDAFFAGHDHNISHEGAVQGTELFVSGAAGKLRPLKRQPDEGNYAISALGYIALELNRDENQTPYFEYEFRILENSKSEEFSTVYTGSFGPREQ